MNRAIGAIVAIVSGTGFAVASMGGAASAAVQCTQETYGQNGAFVWLANGSGPHATGITIPGPAAGETLTVASSSWLTYDYVAPQSTPSRAEQNEQNERFGIAVGGNEVGGLSADLPDSVEQGAASDWSSGVWGGSFFGVGDAVSGGELTLRHASLYGYTESANSFLIKSYSLTLNRCVNVQETTTTGATTTTTGATTTTTGATTTTVAATTTSVGSGGPTTTAATTTSVASAGPTTTVGSASLPSTGGQMTIPLVLAALAGLTGTALLVVRRRPS